MVRPPQQTTQVSARLDRDQQGSLGVGLGLAVAGYGRVSGSVGYHGA